MAGMMQTPGMMQVPVMTTAPGMMQAPGMTVTHEMAAPGMYGCQPLPPAGLVNLDVDVAPGLATLDTEYPAYVSGMGIGTTQGLTQMAPLPSQGPVAYTVRKGDTVYKIARRFGTTMNAIIQTNNLRNPNLIFPGQVLYVPVR